MAKGFKEPKTIHIQPKHINIPTNVCDVSKFTFISPDNGRKYGYDSNGAPCLSKPIQNPVNVSYIPPKESPSITYVSPYSSFTPQDSSFIPKHNIFSPQGHNINISNREEVSQSYEEQKVQKTKEINESWERQKAVEAEKSAVEQAKQLRDTYAQRLQIIEQALRSQTPSEDLDALKEVDPIGYAVKVAENSEKEKQLYAIRAEQARIAQMQQSEQTQHLQQVVAHEAEKLTKFLPEYADPEKGEQVRSNIKKYAESVGFSSDELSKVYDSRAVLTLYKAMQYDKLMSNKGEVTKKVGQAPKMVKSGVGKPIGSLEAEQTKRMKQQLRSSGKVSDAAKLFEKFI
jgi:hypothetical protein